MSAELLLVRAFAAANPEEVARFIERLPPEGGAEVLGALELESAARVLGRAVPLIAASALSRLEARAAGEILEACHPTLAADLLFRMDRRTRATLLEAVTPLRAQDLRRMTDFGPRRAGGRLDPRAPAMPETLAVSEVFDRLRASPAGVMHYVYSIDAERRLTGVVNMRELMLANPEAPLGTIVFRDPEALFAHDPLEVIARHAGWKRNHALPVIDRDRRLLGALRYSTFRAIETELGQAAAGPDVDQTASALAELCALGASAMTRFIGSALALEGPPMERVAPERMTIAPPSSRRSVVPPPGGSS
jgi:Mg/Co/Ni transporter MgtE